MDREREFASRQPRTILLAGGALALLWSFCGRQGTTMEWPIAGMAAGLLYLDWRLWRCYRCRAMERRRGGAAGPRPHSGAVVLWRIHSQKAGWREKIAG